jgi:hypothetical protein
VEPYNKTFVEPPPVVKEEGIYNAGRDKLISIIRKARDAQVLLVVGCSDIGTDREVLRAFQSERRCCTRLIFRAGRQRGRIRGRTDRTPGRGVRRRLATGYCLDEPPNMGVTGLSGRLAEA